MHRITFEVNSHDDREKVVTGLANSGYAVRVIEEKGKGSLLASSNFLVEVQFHATEVKIINTKEA